MKTKKIRIESTNSELNPEKLYINSNEKNYANNIKQIAFINFVNN